MRLKPIQEPIPGNRMKPWPGLTIAPVLQKYHETAVQSYPRTGLIKLLQACSHGFWIADHICDRKLVEVARKGF
jgi:hypothetical protein